MNRNAYIRAKAFRLFLIAALIAGFTLSAMPTPVAHAATFTVNSTADAVDANLGNGTCATAGGVCTLRAAIQEANALGGEDTILLPSSTYTLTISGADDNASAGDLDLTSNVVISATGMTRPIIDGNGSVLNERVFHVTGAFTVTLSGVTIRGGNDQSSNGGGIYDEGGALTLNSSIVSGNTGQGIVNGNGGTLTLNNSIVSQNTNGSGIVNGSTLILNNSTVSGNVRPVGTGGSGGINNSGTVTLDNSTVSGNVGDGILNIGTVTLNTSAISDNSGSGIHTNGGTVTLNNSTINGNAGGEGGGITIFNGGTVNLNNSTISGNVGGDSGGIYVNGSLANVNSSTISNNTGSSAGGIYTLGGLVTLRNSIVAGNTGGVSDCIGNISSAGYNIIGNPGGCLSPGIGDLIVNPMLLSLIGSPGYHPLAPGSPAINAGNPTGCADHLGNPLATDQRGAARVGRCDIGAYEYTVSGPAARIEAFGGTPQHAPPLSDFWIPLKALVLDSIGSPVANTMVIFSAPASGPSGTFAGSGTYTTTAVTNDSGIVNAATFTANGLTGTYTVTASVSGVITPANFSLGNLAWYVAPTGSDSNNCQTTATPCATINGAITRPDFAVGDTVFVASGTYTGTTSPLVLLTKTVRLLGGWNGAFTSQSGTSTLDGQNARQGLRVNSGVMAIIDRFVIENGFSDGGGGISNGGVLTLTYSTVRGNSVGAFGGCTAGGGIANGGTLTLVNSTVSGNTASGFGSGISNGGTLAIINSTISSNTSTCFTGGSIYNTGTITMSNSSVISNTAPNGVGGIVNFGGTVYLQNTILGGNTGTGGQLSDCSGTLNSRGYNLIQNVSGCFISGNTAGNMTGPSPQAGPLQDNGGPTLTHALLPGSPAIDSGNPAGCTDRLGNPLTTDQRGFTRPLWAACDIGAYEAYDVGIRVDLRVTISDSPDPVNAGELLTYTVIITNAGPSAANGVVLTDTLSASVTLNSATASQGACSGTTTIVCNVGTLSANATVTVTIVVTTPNAAATLLTLASAKADEPDPGYASSSDTETTTVNPPIPPTGGSKVYLPLIVRGP